VKLFCIGIKPELTEAKRAQLFREICARLQSNQVQLLNNIFAFRAIPGVPRRAVDAAWPGFLDRTWQRNLSGLSDTLFDWRTEQAFSL
jgi:hypothetical protein